MRSAIPVFIDITHGKIQDVAVLDLIMPEPGCYIVMDKGYTDFGRLYRLHQALSFFVIRAKANLQFRRRYSHWVDKTTGVRSDQTILLTEPKTVQKYPDALRRVSYYAADIDKRFIFLTNNFIASAQTISDLYRYRWQIELFFKWIKQHLRIKRFFGTTSNSVKTQIWIAIGVYVLLAIIKKRLDLKHSLYTILQVLSLTLFEKMPISSAFSRYQRQMSLDQLSNQLPLFDI